MTLYYKVQDLESKIDKLIALLRKINDGFQHEYGHSDVEYGHSDVDRYNKVIKHWNKLIVETLKEMEDETL